MLSSKTFSLEVETIAREKKITHMEAVLEYCKEHQLEPESVDPVPESVDPLSEDPEQESVDAAVSS